MHKLVTHNAHKTAAGGVGSTAWKMQLSKGANHTHRTCSPRQLFADDAVI